jgi:hypothetical protein
MIKRFPRKEEETLVVLLLFVKLVNTALVVVEVVDVNQHVMIVEVDHLHVVVAQAIAVVVVLFVAVDVAVLA